MPIVPPVGATQPARRGRSERIPRAEGTYKTKYIVTRKLRYTFRLIDDITTINSDGYFKEYVDNIYPACLELNKENEGTDRADMLDLRLSIEDGKFISGLYDKRDAFKFDIVQFMPSCCNQSSSVLYGVFSSQIIRISREQEHVITLICL